MKISVITSLLVASLLATPMPQTTNILTGVPSVNSANQGQSSGGIVQAAQGQAQGTQTAAGQSRISVTTNRASATRTANGNGNGNAKKGKGNAKKNNANNANNNANQTPAQAALSAAQRASKAASQAAQSAAQAAKQAAKAAKLAQQSVKSAQRALQAAQAQQSQIAAQQAAARSAAQSAAQAATTQTTAHNQLLSNRPLPKLPLPRHPLLKPLARLPRNPPRLHPQVLLLVRLNKETDCKLCKLCFYFLFRPVHLSACLPVRWLPNFPKMQQKVLVPPLNFSIVQTGIYRSGYPNTKNFEFLSKLGLKTVIYIADDDYSSANIGFFEKENIAVMHFRLVGNKEPHVEMDHGEMQKVLDIVLDRENHPILVHCNKGKASGSTLTLQHRVGCLVGCLRKYHGWSMASIFDDCG
ncbi:hypothetical protein HDV03_000974 [Kappamyces sp. JEL0829]|nr:hypothetical protein HDV03_000974 [Kappamyces sp. JEL0829]